MELISIIMAAYNAEKTLPHAIKSTLLQTYQEFELLIINDGSSDSTSSIAKAYAQQDARVRLIELPQNSGVSNARWVAAKEAQGEWIAILDSDDIWAPDKLEKQMALQKSKNAQLIFTGSAFMDESGERLKGYLSAPTEVTYRKLLKQNVISNSSALVKKDLYVKHYAKGNNMHEDFALWLSVLKTGVIAYGIDEPLLTYRLSKASKSGNKLRSAKMNWNTYRYIGIGTLKAVYYMAWYMMKGINKYRKIG